jgi:hypothetical protein
MAQPSLAERLGYGASLQDGDLTLDGHIFVARSSTLPRNSFRLRTARTPASMIDLWGKNDPLRP